MKTTAVLTLEIPPELRERLNRALRRHPDLSIQDLTRLALDDWLQGDEARTPDRSPSPSRR